MGILNVDNLRAVGSGTSVTCLSNRLETTNINASGIVTATGFVGPFENTGDFTIDDWIVHAGDTNTKFGFPDADTFTIETAGSQRINIRNDGKIQVGTSGGNSTYLTTSTNAALDVWGDGSAYPTLRLGTENYQIVGEDIRFGRIDHGATDIRYHSLVSRHDTTGANNYLQFRIHDAGSSPYQSQKIALHINGLGQVGVGTAAPSGSLGVWDPSGSDPTMSLHHSNADVEGEIIRVGRTDIPTIRYHSIKARHGGAATANFIKFDLHNGSGTTNQSEVLRLEGDGNVTIPDGDLVIGTAGHGIDFSANTNDATGLSDEILDDYEEGLYIPTIVGSSGGSWTTATYRHIAYTKIGRLVHIQGYLQCNSETSPSGTLRIALPFTVGSLTGDAENGAITVSMRAHGGSSNLYNVCGAVSSNYLEIIAINGAGSHNWIDANDVGTSWNIRIGGCYTAT